MSVDENETESNDELVNINLNYHDELIHASDLLVTEEELGLFPDVVTQITIKKENSNVLITEVKEQTAFDMDEKESNNDRNIEVVVESDISRDPTQLIEIEEYINEHELQDDKENKNEDEESDIDEEKTDDFSDEANWETDLEGESEKLVNQHDQSPEGRYREMCQKYDIIPARYYLKHMQNSILAMKHHGLGPLGSKALARSLESNISVSVLDLSGNGMQSVGASAIGRLLEENNFIVNLSLSENMISDSGIRSLCKGLMSNTSLKYLDLSKNMFGDDSCSELSDVIEKNKNLVQINLSRNNIGSKGAYLLGAAIASNDITEDLDLSWNKINGSGAYAIARGLKENVILKRCNLSYNGFAQEGGRAIAETLRDNGNLISINLEANRFDEEIAVLIGQALAVNDNLQEIYLGLNTINTAGVLKLVSSINSSEVSQLKKLSIKNIPVDYEIMKTIHHIKLKRPEFNVEHGLEIAVGNTQEDMTKRMVNRKDPIILLKEHVIIKDKRIVDILERLDEEHNYYVTIEQFAQALEELEIPFKLSQLTDLQTRLDKKGNGTIYYGDFVQNQATNIVLENELPRELTDDMPIEIA